MINFQAVIFFILASCNKNIMNGATHTAATARVVKVATATQLQQALDHAQKGDEIMMADGVYKGNFVIPATANGSPSSPVTLTASGKVILDGNTITKGYVLYLKADYWVIKGFTITNGLKGLMCDGAEYNVIDGLLVHDVGEEAIHLRKFSKHNILQNCTITNTGLKTPDYGEGVYIGSAVSHWDDYTNGAEDRCDSNSIISNKIGPGITAECVDVKEGTTGGIIRENTFNSTGITGANSGDSWIDVKGNSTLIENNTGFNPVGSVLADGYQVHCAVNGWGNNTVFKNNTSAVNAAGYGFNISLSGSKGKVTGTIVYKSNKVTGAAKGVANIGLSE